VVVRHPEFVPHFTPTSSSWLNQVERFFAQITERRIRRGAFTSVAELEQAIEDYLRSHNEHSRPFVWTRAPMSSSTRSANSPNDSPRINQQRTSNSGH